MKKTIIIAAVAALLTACGSDSSTPTTGSTTPTTTPAILVTNTSGGTSDITGTWLSDCVVGSATAPTSPDYRFEETFSGSKSYIFIVNDYTTFDGSCGGTPSERAKITGSLLLGADIVGVGWLVNGLIATNPPSAQDGSLLPSSPTATKMTVTVATVSGQTTTAVGDIADLTRILDNTVTTSPITSALYNDNVSGLVCDLSFKSFRQ